MSNLSCIDGRCKECGGECWHPGDQKATQEAAKKKFGGQIPNHCVNSSKNAVKCPAALGLL